MNRKGIFERAAKVTVGDNEDLKLLLTGAALCSNARLLPPNKESARYDEMGVDVGVNQAEIMAHFVVEEMNLKDMFTILKLNRGEYSIIQIKVQTNAKAAGRLLKDLFIPKRTLLITITRDESTLIPKGDTQILENDDILMLTDESSRTELKEIFG